MKELVILFIVVILGIMSSCSYSVFEPEEAPPVDSTKVYSLALDVQPIFDAKCTGCHGTSGGLSLESDVAYSNIVPDRVNLAVPEESKIYIYPSLSGGHSYEQYSVEEAQTVLQWIVQGALNN